VHGEPRLAPDDARNALDEPWKAPGEARLMLGEPRKAPDEARLVLGEPRKALDEARLALDEPRRAAHEARGGAAELFNALNLLQIRVAEPRHRTDVRAHRVPHARPRRVEPRTCLSAAGVSGQLMTRQAWRVDEAIDEPVPR